MKPILSDLYNASQIWVYADFLVEDVDELPKGWISSTQEIFKEQSAEPTVGSGYGD